MYFIQLAERSPEPSVAKQMLKLYSCLSSVSFQNLRKLYYIAKTMAGNRELVFTSQGFICHQSSWYSSIIRKSTFPYKQRVIETRRLREWVVTMRQISKTTHQWSRDLHTCGRAVGLCYSCEAKSIERVLASWISFAIQIQKKVSCSPWD